MSKEHAIPFPDEQKHLKLTLAKLEEALKKAEESVQNLDSDYRNAKRYMAENRGELDPHEMFQNELLLKQTDQTGAFAVEIRNKLTRLKESPYFARIDFRFQGEEVPEAFYIGRSAFFCEKRPLIFDWRAPISSMFYDCELGPAGYAAPEGRIEGELTRKRQFKIKDGVIEYTLETSATVQDDILQKELSHTSDEKMKSIISTIQKEQNQIIRKEKVQTLIIQGVAGSGKTSIALHRIAFLLYRFRGQLNANNIAILSPNKVFGDYISNVIPELGEEPIYELSLAEIAGIQLGHTLRFERERDPLAVQDAKWIQRMRFKSTLQFLSLLEAYRKQVPELVFHPLDYSLGSYTIPGAWIKKRFLSYQSLSVRERLGRTAEDICDRLKTDLIMEDEFPTVTSIQKSLAGMLTVKSSLSLYKAFYRSIHAPDMLRLSGQKELEWTDVCPYLYLASAFDGLKTSRLTRHLVIDEMQDYTPVQYAVINLLFPCTKTILGDFGQGLNPSHLHTLEDIRRLYPEAEYITLNKSYRSTYEIITFARQFQDVPSMEAVKRHGEKPGILCLKSKGEEVQYIYKAICDFRSGNLASLGIILKTEKEAENLYHILSRKCRIHLLTPESSCFKNGVTVTSVRMAKGLEFDEVILPGGHKSHWSSAFDRRLLYIACTRAMHRLTLTFIEKKS